MNATYWACLQIICSFVLQQIANMQMQHATTLVFRFTFTYCFRTTKEIWLLVMCVFSQKGLQPCIHTSSQETGQQHLLPCSTLYLQQTTDFSKMLWNKIKTIGNGYWGTSLRGPHNKFVSPARHKSINEITPKNGIIVKFCRHNCSSSCPVMYSSFLLVWWV